MLRDSDQLYASAAMTAQAAALCEQCVFRLPPMSTALSCF
jgi:hypothetical protein